MKFFGRTVAWKANEQVTVITLSIKAELLAISQIAKEVIYFSRLMQALHFVRSKIFTIKCDNAQIIQLFIDKFMKLQTTLRHIDIQLHWLRQKVQRGLIHILWVLTKEIIANGRIKAFSSAQTYDFFMRMTGIEDKKDFLASIKGEKDTFQQLQTDFEYSEVYGFGANTT